MVRTLYNLSLVHWMKLLHIGDHKVFIRHDVFQALDLFVFGARNLFRVFRIDLGRTVLEFELLEALNLRVIESVQVADSLVYDRLVSHLQFRHRTSAKDLINDHCSMLPSSQLNIKLFTLIKQIIKAIKLFSLQEI